MLDQNVKSLLAAGEITWDLLWALFPPNVLVYRYHELTRQHQILRFRTMKKRKIIQTDTIQWEFSCDVIVDDGEKFGVAKEPIRMNIPEFKGVWSIVDLRFFPLDRHKDSEVLWREALERGKRYAAIKERHLAQTSGFAMFEDRTQDFYQPYLYKFATHGRAIVDASAFRHFNPNVSFIPRVHRSLSREGLSDEQLIICHPVALGFSFGDKKWGTQLSNNCTQQSLMKFANASRQVAWLWETSRTSNGITRHLKSWSWIHK